MYIYMYSNKYYTHAHIRALHTTHNHTHKHLGAQFHTCQSLLQPSFHISLVVYICIYICVHICTYI